METVNRKFQALSLLAVILGVVLLAACAQADPAEGATDEETEPEMDMEEGEDEHEMEDTEEEGEHEEMEDMEEEGEHDDMGHGEAMIDPDAPVFELSTIEFEFDPSDLEVEAGVFTIHIDNEEGVIEHDLTIEGFEDQGGAHAQPGEEAMASFELEAGTYTFYCTIAGHREAGMEGTLTVAA